MSIAGPNFFLNTIVADVLEEFADELEKAPVFTDALNALIKKTLQKHSRIIFNGNGYDEEWVKEAQKRGLLNLKTTTDALPYFIHPKNIELFKKHGVLSPEEVHSRYEINMEEYCKILNIEVLTMCEMGKKEIIPAAIRFAKDTASAALEVKKFIPKARCLTQEKLVTDVTNLTDELSKRLEILENKLLESKEKEDITSCGKFYTSDIIPAMNEVRAVADELETMVSSDYWPFPTYSDLLFKI